MDEPLLGTGAVPDTGHAVHQARCCLQELPAWLQFLTLKMFSKPPEPERRLRIQERVIWEHLMGNREGTTAGLAVWLHIGIPGEPLEALMPRGTPRDSGITGGDVACILGCLEGLLVTGAATFENYW